MAILTVPSESELRCLTDAYALGPLEDARGIQAGTVNTSYALRLGGRPWFLRIYEEQEHAGAEAEAELLVHLAAAGVPTPRPEMGRDGRRVRSVRGKPAALFPWVDGTMRCQASVDPEAGRAVGVALAKVHDAGAPAGSPLGAGRFGPEDLAARCARVASAKDEAARPLAPSLHAGFLAFAASRDASLPCGLVHGDLFRDNVLWEGFAITALLDFESAFVGPFVYDLAVTMLAWSFGDALIPGVARAIVDGYRSVRELEPPERAALFDESVFAAMRFTTTRITDDAIRVGKRWQRFVARREAIEQLGRTGLAEVLGL
jgi:homoserine kinase type II